MLLCVQDELVFLPAIPDRDPEFLAHHTKEAAANPEDASAPPTVTIRTRVFDRDGREVQILEPRRLFGGEGARVKCGAHEFSEVENGNAAKRAKITE